MSSLQETGLIVSLIMSAISLLAWVYTVGFKMGALDTKVTTLWEVYVKDALSEATRLQRGNPIKIEDIINDNLKEAIRNLVCKNPHKHDELVIKIEKTFGNDLMKIATEKKLPYRVLIGTAILIAEGTLK